MTSAPSRTPVPDVVASIAGEAETTPVDQVAAAIIADGPTVVTDTVAFATNNGGGGFATPGAEGLFLEANGGSDVVRNSTVASAAGSLGFALEARGTVGTTVATLQNTIVSGGGNGLLVAEESGATMTVNADHDRISGESARHRRRRTAGRTVCQRDGHCRRRERPRPCSGQ